MKKLLISFISTILMISAFCVAYATTGSMTSSASTNSVIKGKTFTVTVAATADSPIVGMYTKLNFDKNVLSIESKKPADNYGDNSGNNEEILVTGNMDTPPTSVSLYTLTFKVLDTANVGSTTISFNESELHLDENGTTKEVPTTIASVTIDVKEDTTTAGGSDNTTPDNTPDTTPDDTKNPSSNDNKDIITNTSSNTDSGNSNKNTTKKLPQTGLDSTVLFAIVGVSIFGIISYVSYRKYNMK